MIWKTMNVAIHPCPQYIFPVEKSIIIKVSQLQSLHVVSDFSCSKILMAWYFLITEYAFPLSFAISLLWCHLMKSPGELVSPPIPPDSILGLIVMGSLGKQPFSILQGHLSAVNKKWWNNNRTLVTIAVIVNINCFHAAKIHPNQWSI